MGEDLAYVANKARDALQVALLGVEVQDDCTADVATAAAIDGAEDLSGRSRSKGVKARDAMDAALILESETMRSGLSTKQLKQLKSKAKNALNFALLNEAEN